MKTYTFKLFAKAEEVVVAAHMDLEQFYDSVKMTCFEGFLEKYPDAYLTASDYHTSSGVWYTRDSVIGTLKGLLESKSLKQWLISLDFLDFVDEVKEDGEV